MSTKKDCERCQGVARNMYRAQTGVSPLIGLSLAQEEFEELQPECPDLNCLPRQRFKEGISRLKELQEERNQQ